MHKDLVRTILDESPLAVAAVMYDTNVLSKENYEVMMKLDERTPNEQTAVLLHFLRQATSNPIKYKLFIESIKLWPAQQQFYSKLYSTGKFALSNQYFSCYI